MFYYILESSLVFKNVLGAWIQISWGVCFLPHVSKMFTLEYIQIVQNLATRACGGTVVYPGRFYGKFHRGFAFYPMSLKSIV